MPELPLAKQELNTMLIKLSDDAYLFPGRTNIMFIKSQGIMIDTGISEDASRKALRDAASENINVKLVINTHHHIDHVGGNSYVVKKTNATVAMNKIEKFLLQNTLISSLLDLGYPLVEGSITYSVENLEDIDFTDEIKVINLSGHSPGMIGFIHDDVVFTSDLFFSTDVLSKYVIPFHIDVEKTLMKLNEAKSIIRDKLYVVPSHGPVMNPSLADDVIEANISRILFVKSKITEILAMRPTWTYEELIRLIMDSLGIKQENGRQFLLNRRAIESYLGWLQREDSISIKIEGGNLAVNVNKL
jgi:glyoxylase-like metal-dependent hydrolase (beta-lactamase superfamily II)